MEKNHNKKSVLIIANGESPGDDVLRELVSKSDIIIAADGGSKLCYQKNINPDFIIGDLDSIEKPILDHFRYCEIIKIADQDSHDLEKAIRFSQTLKPEIVRITAAFGKRFDHSLANLLLLQKQYREQSLEFYDEFGCLSMISGKFDLDQPVGRIVSLFSFLPISGLSLIGFQYTLSDAEYPYGFSGLSNVVQQRNASIQMKKGSLFIYIANENIKS
jgi:thiamine pyrophosphokinase